MQNRLYRGLLQLVRLETKNLFVMGCTVFHYPWFEGRMQLSGLCMPKVTTDFPLYHLQVVQKDRGYHFS